MAIKEDAPARPLPRDCPIELRRCLHGIRGKWVILDRDLARLGGMRVARLRAIVAQNRDQFQRKHLFRLTSREFNAFKSRIAKSSAWRRGHVLPYAFTDKGGLMLGYLDQQRLLQGIKAFEKRVAKTNPKLLIISNQMRKVLGPLLRKPKL